MDVEVHDTASRVVGYSPGDLTQGSRVEHCTGRAAFENLVNLLDSAFLNGMCVIVDHLYNRFVTELLWRNDERCRCSARLLVSQFFHNKLTN